MAISVGSNFLYQGKKFLDDRQNKAKTTKDLKLWNIPVPDGFEIFIEGSWYVFNSSNPENEITGKFKKRTEISQDFGTDTEKTISQSTITNKFTEVEKYISKLQSSVFPLEFKTFSGGGTFEIGSNIIPKLSWTVGIKGESDILIPDEVTVNGIKDGISEDLSSYTGSCISLSLPGKESYQVYVRKDYLSATKTVDFNFCYKRYYGTSPKSELTSSDIISMNSNFITGNSYTMASTTFDCTGGKYPYYIIPKSIYKTNLEFWVGGLKNSDTVIENVNVRTVTGLEVEYVTIRLKNIQTGKLSIQIK